MNKINTSSRRVETATAILVSFLLFYFPAVLTLFSRSGEPTNFTIMSAVMGTFYTLVFCINYFWLIPATLVRTDNKPLFFISNICIIVAICSLIPLWFESQGGFPRPRHNRHADLTTWQYLFGYFRFILRDGIMMILSVSLAYALRLSMEREKLRRQELELSAEKRHIELKNLKAQLNPHFLFNSINNIYALIGFAPERAQQALHDLSNILRFMIYDSPALWVPLSKEIQFIRDYIELMRLRLNKNIDMRCDLISDPDPTLMVSPLLMLTLIENAFKHSGPNGEDNFIHVDINIKDNMLVCRVSNSYDEKKENPIEKNDNESGVGLANIKRQLGLLYPHQHTLDIDKNNGIYKATIKISVAALKRSESYK